MQYLAILSVPDFNPCHEPSCKGDPVQLSNRSPDGGFFTALPESHLGANNLMLDPEP